MARVANKDSSDDSSLFYIHFQTNTLRKGMNPLIPPAMGEIVSLLFFYKDVFGIKYLLKVDMPLKQRNQTKTGLT